LSNQQINRIKKVDLLMLARLNVSGAEGVWLSINLGFENF